MKQTALLTTASLLTILFMTIHLAGDIVFRLSPPGLLNLVAVFIFVVQLYGTLVLGGRRAGYIIVFFASMLALVMPLLHMRGTGHDLRRHRQLQPSFSFRVDTPRVEHHRDVFHYSIGERTVEFALATEPPRVNCRVTPVAAQVRGLSEPG